LGKARRLDILTKATSFAWKIGDVTRLELRQAETREPVERLVLEQSIQVAEFDSSDIDGMTLFAEWSERVDPGEAEAIALALSRKWLVGLEDLDARRLLDRHAGPGRWINCANILIDAHRVGKLTIEDAETAFSSLDVYPSYVKSGVHKLSDLLR